MTKPKNARASAIQAASNSPPELTQGSEVDSEQIQIMKDLVREERREYERRKKASVERLIKEYASQSAAIVKKHNHLIKTHITETENTYAELSTSISESDKSTQALHRELDQLITRKTELMETLEKSVNTSFESSQTETEGCLQAWAGFVSSIAQKTTEKTQGMVGVGLEQEIEAKLALIRPEEEA